jgi:hypothetical protein
MFLDDYYTLKEKSNKGNIGELIEVVASALKPKESA